MRTPFRFLRTLATAVILLVAAPAATASAVRREPPPIVLNGEIELARLVDLCASRAGLPVEYDAAALKGTVTIRVDGELTNEELWALANELLGARGFATVQRPGSPLLSVVRIADAPAAARVEPDVDSASVAGFRTVVVRVVHRPPKEIAEALRAVLSKPSGTASQIGETDLLLIADFVPRIAQATRLLEQLDVPGAERIETYEARNLKAAELVGLAIAAAAARDESAGRKLRGKPLASPDGAAVVLVGTPSDVAAWRGLVEAFDRPPEIATVTYPVRHYAAAEVARLVEASGRDAGPRGSGAKWRVVVDEITGSLVVTASPSEHAAIVALLDRLAAQPPDARRQIRSFAVRNRPIREVVDVLRQLVDSGALGAASLEAAPGEAPISARPNAVSQQSEAIGPLATSTVRAAQPAPAASPATTQPVRDAPLSIMADEGTNSLLVVGEPRLVAQIESLLRAIDVRQPQVVLEVLVVGLTDGQAIDLGVELRKIEINGLTTISLLSLFGLSSSSGSSTPAGTGGTVSILRPGDFSILIRALETLNAGRTLNIPKVLVTNNQEATLTSVLQQPYLQTNASTTVATTSFGGSQDAGTTVRVRPQISQGDHLILDYAVAISSFVGDSADPAVPPPRQQNTLQSVVEIPDGFTVAVGGLRVETDVRGTTQIPLLGDIPVLGEAFKSRSNSRSDTKFYVFIRANVLRQTGFEDLKHVSDIELGAAGVADGFPSVEPRAIR